jgi:hypothetical protein
MLCPEKRSLLRKYKLYVRAHKDAVEQLSLISLEAARAEWDLALVIATRASNISNEAFLLLQKHTQEHGC